MAVILCKSAQSYRQIARLDNSDRRRVVSITHKHFRVNFTIEGHAPSVGEFDSDCDQNHLESSHRRMSRNMRKLRQLCWIDLESRIPLADLSLIPNMCDYVDSCELSKLFGLNYREATHTGHMLRKMIPATHKEKTAVRCDRWKRRGIVLFSNGIIEAHGDIVAFMRRLYFTDFQESTVHYVINWDRAEPSVFIADQMIQHFEVKIIISQNCLQYVFLIGSLFYMSILPIPSFIRERVVGARHRLRYQSHKPMRWKTQTDENNAGLYEFCEMARDLASAIDLEAYFKEKAGDI